MSQESEVDQPPQPAVAQPPEVDELGYPTNELPKEIGEAEDCMRGTWKEFPVETNDNPKAKQ